jgi:hypothetical protein
MVTTRFSRTGPRIALTALASGAVLMLATALPVRTAQAQNGYGYSSAPRYGYRGGATGGSRRGGYGPGMRGGSPHGGYGPGMTGYGPGPGMMGW